MAKKSKKERPEEQPTVAVEEKVMTEEITSEWNKAGMTRIEDFLRTMPKDDPDSNNHNLTATYGRVSCDGMFARDFEMEHEEHASLKPDSSQWYTFARNTAKRSVSMDGVD